MCFSIDACTSERLGKFINDSPKRYANCAPKAVMIDDKPHLLIFATKVIQPGTELRYDYGGGDLSWRKVSILFMLLLIISIFMSVEHNLFMWQVNTCNNNVYYE